MCGGGGDLLDRSFNRFRFKQTKENIGSLYLFIFRYFKPFRAATRTSDLISGQFFLMLQSCEMLYVKTLTIIVGFFTMKALWPLIFGRVKVLWNPEHHQNLIICFLAHCDYLLRIILKYVSDLLSDFENSQARQTSKSRLTLNLLGRGNCVYFIRNPGTVKISCVS